MKPSIPIPTEPNACACSLEGSPQAPSAGAASLCSVETHSYASDGSKDPVLASLAIPRRSFALASAAAVASLLTGCGGSSVPAASRIVTDMGDTERSVPEHVSRVFCTNPIGSVNLYCLMPDAMVGWNFKPAAGTGYIPQQYLDLPALGVWMGAGNTPNPEEIAAQSPDVLLCFWTADDAGRSMVKEIESQTSRTTLLVDYQITALPSAFRFMGGLLEDCQDRAEELAVFCEKKIATIQTVAAKVEEGERKSIYLAQSTGGLSTDPVGSMHLTDALELCGVDNVADLPGTVGQGMGMPTVNLEQIIQWNPDAVLVSEYVMGSGMGDGSASADGSSGSGGTQTSDLYGEILSDDGWQQVPAVKAGAVYGIPQAPFSWFGRPPSIMRLLGCMMLQKLLYPQAAKDVDIRKEAKEFFAELFGVDVTKAQLDELLKNTGL